MKLKPKDLKSFIDKDNRFRRAEALLHDQWESLLLSEPWGMTMITRADISFARALVSAKIVSTNVDLATFKGVQKFIHHNIHRLSPDVIQSLKEPFL
ncbi:hypothetical protein GCM10025879_07000 [Leuconostoc litchii]|uniref:Uncharacterized protein n=1 Tax=Leuconostoc litchii TaxID=1981069 RepID=A0A6P2CT43_9LACO|nr:hypothetical protein [Leuconostoc litchii]TYC47437.1 hypothetical protein ESZ47_04675 [Leuconostoc litchii]GMA69454.1 hypothetical protein GCM10025879_07000 [Leuconostoc litchii]